MNKNLDEIIDEFSKLLKELYSLDESLQKCGLECLNEYEEEVDLWKTYGGD